MDITDTISEIYLKAFDLDYFSYLQQKHRNLYGIRLMEDKSGNVINCCKMFGPDQSALIDAIKEKGLCQSVAGYLPDAGGIINIPDLNGDLLLVSDTFLNVAKHIQIALLFHELCHLIIEAKLKYKHLLAPESLIQGKNIRKYTQFDENDRWHTEEWFALLFSTSVKMVSGYPNFYRSHQDIVQCSLKYDLFSDDLPMENIEWIKVSIQGS